MRLALAQLNPTVGDIAGNTQRLIAAVDAARRDGASLVIGPELGVIGYPPRDLLLRDGVLDACDAAVDRIAAAAGGVTVLVGHPRRADGASRPLRNSVSVVRDGAVLARYDKRLLPTYDVFDEDRYFSPGTGPLVVDVDGVRVGVLICEDLWNAADVDVERRYGVDCVGETMAAGCDLLAVPSASPFVRGKDRRHLEQLRATARRADVAVAAVNQVGANDDLIFDGGSAVVDPDGGVRRRLPSWEEATGWTDVGAGLQRDRVDEETETEDEAHLAGALVLGVRDYVRKTGNSEVVLGLSGGIDSALTATLAAAALGPEHVIGLLMPSRHSSTGSVDDAVALADALGMTRASTVPIETGHAALAGMVAPVLGEAGAGVVDENLQSRVRGATVMAVSNGTGALALATGNKSELAMGYATLYGDMIGALSVLGDVLKTRVYALSRWINEHPRRLGFDRPPIPTASISKPPSAELRPDQTDQDSLPPYDQLDAVLEALVEREESVSGAVRSTGLDVELVRRIKVMLDRNEYKRRQAPLVLKVTGRAFGPGRRMPLAMRAPD